MVIDSDDKAASIVQNIHWTGAFLAFVGGLIWMTIQSWFSVNFCSCPTLERHVEVQNQEHQHLQIRRFVDNFEMKIMSVMRNIRCKCIYIPRVHAKEMFKRGP